MIECDIRICVGCKTCEVACSTVHFGAVSPAMSRIRVAKLEETGLDLSVACISCLEKPCLDCPAEALTVGAAGAIVLDPGNCNGCKVCVEECPIGAAGFYDDQPLFCDLCNGEPACIPLCPSGALRYRDDFRDASLQPFLPAYGGSGEKRARYAVAKGEPVRAAWKTGTRIDS